MTWIVTVHSGEGSMVEAADPQFATLVDTEKQAKDLSNAINGALSTRSDDWWCIYYEIHFAKALNLPQASAQQLAAAGMSLAPGKVGLDIDALVERLLDGHPIELLPPEPEPVGDADLAAAIASITGAQPTHSED